MVFLVSSGSESLRAEAAAEGLHACVHALVNHQIALFREPLIASFERTDK